MEKPKKITVSSDISLLYIGPDIQEGPLPAVFYFALSAEDSLCLDPFNQFVTALHDLPLRVFSMTLPGHEEGRKKEMAIEYWAQEMRKGNDIFKTFINQGIKAVEYCLKKQFFDKDKLAFAGLSRGAFIASHLAAKLSYVNWILGFAPLTTLSSALEFQEMQVTDYDLEKKASQLAKRQMRFYIGNADTRVHTSLCFSFVEKLVHEAKTQKVRIVPIELIIGPSIGFKGHGTSPATFQSGAMWLKKELLNEQ